MFQPHRYTPHRRASGATSPTPSSTPTCVVLTDVYAAGEAPQPGVSGRLSSRRCSTPARQAGSLYLPKRADVLALLPELTRPGDLVVTLGAGDITSLPDEWLALRAGA